MERKLGAKVRSSRSIARYERPRIVVAPRTYMDVMTPTTARPTQSVAKAKTAHPKKELVQLRQQPQTNKYFDMKPAPPLKPNYRVARTLKPISKELLTPLPATTVPKPVPIQPSPEVSEAQTVPEEHAKPVALKKKRRLFKKPSKWI